MDRMIWLPKKSTSTGGTGEDQRLAVTAVGDTRQEKFWSYHELTRKSGDRARAFLLREGTTGNPDLGHLLRNSPAPSQAS